MTTQLAKPSTGPNPLTFLSAFCGCGGFDLGFAAAGYKCLGAYDIDPTALEAHHSNLGGPAIRCDLSRGMPTVPGITSPDVLLAGSPCQGFSTLGARRIDDPRNDLVLAAGRIAVAIQPKVFIAENVIGVTSGEHKRYWNQLQIMLRDDGYQATSLILDASQLGVPQKRRRMLLVAWKTGALSDLHFPVVRGAVLREALRGVEGVPDHEPQILSNESAAYRIARHIGEGQKLSNVRAGARAVHTWEIPEVYGVTTAKERQLLEVLLLERRRNRIRAYGDADPVTLSRLHRVAGYPVYATVESLLKKGYLRSIGRRIDLTHTFNGKFRRPRWDEVSPTVDTKFGEYRLFLHPSQHRAFTIREAARIQTFPDWFSFTGTPKERYRMIGNAVPPILAMHLAHWLRETLLPSTARIERRTA